jgi:hypothetical protein
MQKASVLGTPEVGGQYAPVRVLLGLRRRGVLPRFVHVVAERLFNRGAVETAVPEADSTAVVDRTVGPLEGADRTRLWFRA